MGLNSTIFTSDYQPVLVFTDVMERPNWLRVGQYWNPYRRDVRRNIRDRVPPKYRYAPRSEANRKRLFNHVTTQCNGCMREDVIVKYFKATGWKSYYGDWDVDYEIDVDCRTPDACEGACPIYDLDPESMDQIAMDWSIQNGKYASVRRRHKKIMKVLERRPERFLARRHPTMI